MQKNEKAKHLLLIILLVALIGLSIAYATLTQYLYINSQAVILGQSTGWRVEFTSASCHANGSAAITHDFVISATDLSSLETKFTAPGDSIVCNIRVANNGVINAKLSSFIIQDGNLSYSGTGANQTNDINIVTGKIQHSIVYAEGDQREGQVPAANDTLPAGTHRDLVLTITYPMNADLPNNDVTVAGLRTTFLYSQD